MEKSKITKSLAVFASVLLIIIIGVASFAYFGTFNVNLVNNVAVNINSSSPGNATFTSTATQLNLQVPAANMSFTVANNEVAAKEDTAFLDVTLTGSANLLTTCTYDIVYEYDAGTELYSLRRLLYSRYSLTEGNQTYWSLGAYAQRLYQGAQPHPLQ